MQAGIRLVVILGMRVPVHVVDHFRHIVGIELAVGECVAAHRLAIEAVKLIVVERN